MNNRTNAKKLRKYVSLLIAVIMAFGGVAAIAEEVISASVHVNAKPRMAVTAKEESSPAEEAATNEAKPTEAPQKEEETQREPSQDSREEEQSEEASEETSEEEASEEETSEEQPAEETGEQPSQEPTLEPDVEPTTEPDAALEALGERVQIKEVKIVYDGDLKVGQTAHATMTIKVGNDYGVVPRDFKLKPEAAGAEITLDKKTIHGMWANADGLLSDGDRESDIFKLEFDVTPASEDGELKFNFFDIDEKETKFASETVSFRAAADAEATGEAAEPEATEEPAVEPVLSIQTNGDPASMVAGDTLEMTAGISGMDGVDYSIVWQCNYGGEWNDVPGTEGAMSYSVELTEDNLGCSWRFKLSTPDEEPAQEEDVE